MERKTTWADQRLRNLFDRYNRIYWQGSLSMYRVIISSLASEGCIGRCNRINRLIEIDPDGHTSDKQLRSTLLHEMCHATSRGGHSLEFFREVERLLKRRAPVSVYCGEAGRAKILNGIIPKQFPLLRKKMERIEKQRVRELEAHFKSHPPDGKQVITNDDIVAEFEDEERVAVTWKQARFAVGLQYGLTDEAGRPVDGWAKRLLERGRRAHAAARRYHLQWKKQWRAENPDLPKKPQ
jgi:hypothetical protein